MEIEPYDASTVGGHDDLGRYKRCYQLYEATCKLHGFITSQYSTTSEDLWILRGQRFRLQYGSHVEPRSIFTQAEVVSVRYTKESKELMVVLKDDLAWYLRFLLDESARKLLIELVR